MNSEDSSTRVARPVPGHEAEVGSVSRLASTSERRSRSGGARPVPDGPVPDGPVPGGTVPGGPVPRNPVPAGIDLHALLDNLHGTVVFRMIDTPSERRRFLYVSQSIEAEFGVSRDAVMTDILTWYGLLDPADLPRMSRLEQRAAETMTPFYVEAGYTVRGQRRDFAIRSMPRDASAEHGAGAIVWDGTAQDVTVDAAARDRATMLANAVDATEDLVLSIERDGTIIYANAAAREHLDLDSEQPDGANLNDVTPVRLRPLYRDTVRPRLKSHGTWSGDAAIILPDGSEMPVSQATIAHRDSEGRIGRLSVILRDISGHVASERALREANERTKLVLSEVNHRVKNLFTLVPAIVQLSARGKRDVSEVVNTVRDRVAALARSHTLTISSFSEEQGIALDALVDAVLEPFSSRAKGIALHGPTVRLSARDGNAMALMLHELATNAAKYGALSGPAGKVGIEWTVEPGEPPVLTLRWQETGGPPPAAPAPRSPAWKTGDGGFGTDLVDRLVASQSGTVERDWSPEGLRLIIALPLYEGGPPKAALR